MAHTGRRARAPGTPCHLPLDALVRLHFGEYLSRGIHHGEEVLDERRIAGEVSAGAEERMGVVHVFGSDGEVEVNDIVEPLFSQEIPTYHFYILEPRVPDVLFGQAGEFGPYFAGPDALCNPPEIDRGNAAAGPGIEHGVPVIHSRVGDDEADVLWEHGGPAPAGPREEVSGAGAKRPEVLSRMGGDDIPRGCLQQGVEVKDAPVGGKRPRPGPDKESPPPPDQQDTLPGLKHGW